MAWESEPSVRPSASSASSSASRMLIDGEWVDSTDGKSFEVREPVAGSVLGVVPEGGRADINRAVEAAYAAFVQSRWRGLSGADRGTVLWRAAELIQERADQLADLESANLGIPVAQARRMVSEAAGHFRYCAGWTDKIHGKTADIGSPAQRYHGYTLREPVGVAGLIVPWNVPLIAASKKLAAALAAGCSCVLKPAEETPLTALVLGEILVEAGIPHGVVNIVTGFGVPAGSSLASHPKVDKVAFTGSTEVGKEIVRAAAGNLKRLTLELGGKSPVIVLPDADLATTVPGVAHAVFWNSGQICTAGTRLFVHSDIYDAIVEGVADAGSRLKVGDPKDPSTDLGPLISEPQLERVIGYVESGIADGATLVTGGSRIGTDGFFFEPTVMVDVNQGMRMMREEIFGPVLGVMPFTDINEAVEAANDSSYGLAASIWTRNVGAAHTIARELRVGRVSINAHRVGGPQLPAGGFRESGWGREASFEGIEQYLETKSVYVALDSHFQ